MTKEKAPHRTEFGKRKGNSEVLLETPRHVDPKTKRIPPLLDLAGGREHPHDRAPWPLPLDVGESRHHEADEMDDHRDGLLEAHRRESLLPCDSVRVGQSGVIGAGRDESHFEGALRAGFVETGETPPCLRGSEPRRHHFPSANRIILSQ